MPKRPDLKKIFVIGSGPIVIGQGCEFDYSGTQACKALREENCEIILLNSNPATVMTDADMADKTYVAPMTLATCQEIIKNERPDALLPTLGGQTALNLAVELFHTGTLSHYDVRLIGASIEAIEKAENRKLFREAMQRIGLETPAAYTVNALSELSHLALSFPMMIRTSFTLGGSGSAIAKNFNELHAICSAHFEKNQTALELEESLLGWKEFEMEAIRDRADNCIIVCSIENMDPMGIHTGDSITVAPTQTLCNKEYQKMRSATFAILREIGVDTGGANVQFAVNPQDGRMLVIEMNPRVSRSSALASKATGYPIAKIAAKLALGYTLDELQHSLTSIPAAFEPSIDYVVTKLPRFNFEKFPHHDGLLTTKMQSTGEAIGIGRNFKESLLKAIYSIDKHFFSDLPAAKNIAEFHHDRLFSIFKHLMENHPVETIANSTGIDSWFITQCSELTTLIKSKPLNLAALKRAGFADADLAKLFDCDENFLRAKRQAENILPVYKSIDSCAAEFSSKTACLYSTYEFECEVPVSSRQKIVILGSGPNRIGQGLEFDYSSVHAALACRELGYETIMINCNPETVSTDYDIVDRLYLEPLTFEHVMNIIEKEKPFGVIAQFGGQTALNLALKLAQANAPLLGTTATAIDRCENRDSFKQFVADLNLLQANNFCLHTIEEWKEAASQIQYPVIVRPSYLLSGSAMKIIHSEKEFLSYADSLQSQYFPILIEQYLENAIEVEVDGIADGEDVFIPGIIEQFEPAGIHSGDSICYFPPYRLTAAVQEKILEQSRRLILALQIKGLFNIQFAVKNDKVFVIEVNPRASRALPFLSKALGVSLPNLAMRSILGEKLKPLPAPKFFSIKIPVFPFERLGSMPMGPEMRSTGEMMKVSRVFQHHDATSSATVSLQALS